MSVVSIVSLLVLAVLAAASPTAVPTSTGSPTTASPTTASPTASPTPSPTVPAGTTPNIDEIALGTCYFEKNQFQYDETDCAGAWAAFREPFLTIPKEEMNMTSFDAFLSAADHDIPRDSALFWSGTNQVTLHDSFDSVHALSAGTHRYWTLEDTLWGGMLNKLNFCAADMGSGEAFNFTTCPPYGSINVSQRWVGRDFRYPQYAFWPAASKHFATKAAGDVYMLAYARPGQIIYRVPSDSAPGSIFATIEIQNLNASQITSFNIMILVNTSSSSEERCGHGSVVNLTRDLTLIAGINASLIHCDDNPDEVAHLLCIDDPLSKWCAFARSSQSPPYEALLGLLLFVGYGFALLQLKHCGSCLPSCVKEHNKNTSKMTELADRK